jgi:ABC-type glycerol-3-phosphate transport system substrate-binding protein
MDMSNRAFTIAAVLLLATLLVSACAPAAVPTAPPAVIQTVVVKEETIKEVPVTVAVPVTVEVPGAKEVVVATPTVAPTKITAWFFGSEDQKLPDGTPIGQWWRDNVVKPFMAENPGIEVDFAMKGQEAGGTTLFIDTAFAAGQPPDAYMDSLFRMGKFGQKDALLPLNPILPPEKRARIDPQALQAATKNGITWAILTDNSFPDALIVNRAVFKAKGVEDLLPKGPDRDWTTEEFEKACQAVNDPPNDYCTFFFAKTPSYDHAMFCWLAPYGAQRFTPGDYTHVTDNSPEAIAGHKWIKSVLDRKMAVPGPAGLVDDDMDAYLLGGKTVIGSGGWYEQGLVQAGQKDGSLKVEWDPYMVNYPHPADKKPGPMCNLGGRGWSAFKTGDHAKEAAALKFIDYVTNPDLNIKVQTAAGGGLAGIPLITPEGWDPKTLYGDNEDWNWIIRMAQERGTLDMGYTAPNFNELRAKWAEMRQAAWSGDMTVEAASADWEKKANEILTRK